MKYLSLPNSFKSNSWISLKIFQLVAQVHM